MRITEDFESCEVAILAVKLGLLAELIGLADREIEIAVGVPKGAWPISRSDLSTCLDVQQETRLRHLLEVCERARSLFASEAAAWFHKRNRELDVSPVEFLKSDATALRALRDGLRAEMRRT